MVHVGLGAELTLVAAGVAEAVPGFDADEGRLLLVGTPESNDGTLVVDGDGRRPVRVEQLGTVCLRGVNLHAVVAEKVVVESDEVALCLYGHFDHLVGAVDVALDARQRLVVVIERRARETNDASQWLVLATAWCEEGRVSANLEVQVLSAGVLDVPDDVQLVARQTVGDGEVEAEGEDLQRLLRLVQGVGELCLCVVNEFECRVAGKAVAGQVIGLAVDIVRVVLDAADDGEEDRRAAWPFLSTLPQVLAPVGVFDALELGSHFTDLDGEVLIL